MEFQHKVESEEEEVFVFPKVEVTLNEVEKTNLTENTVKINTIESNNGDPLLVLVKEESCIDEFSQSISNAHADEKDDIKMLSSEEGDDDNDVDSGSEG